MDKIAGMLLIAILAIVSVASLSYYVLSQPNQTQNSPSPTPPPTPTPTPTPAATFSPSPSGEPTSIPKPSIPEFTLKYVEYSYDVPPSTTTKTVDPYTGEQTVITEPGYHVKNGTIEVTIKNQEFTPYSIDNQHTISLFYVVSYKGHYAEDWTYYPPYSHGREYTGATNIPQSTSDYTVVQFSAPSGGEMDFRVGAQIGYYTSRTEFIAVSGAPFTTYTFHGEISGWSTTQTITIPTG